MKTSLSEETCALKELDKKGGNPVPRKVAVIKEIEKLCNIYNLIDIWRSLNPGVKSLTWRNKSFKIQCRWGYFLISKELRDLVTSCKITQRTFKAETVNQKKGPGFWKFNHSLLKDERYTNKLRENIVQYKEKYKDVDDLGLRWGLIKMEIRGLTIMHSKTKAKMEKTEETDLQNKANELKLKAEQNPNDKKAINELYAVNLHLEKLLKYKTRGAILRSKSRWYEQGERNTRYFFKLE